MPTYSQAQTLNGLDVTGTVVIDAADVQVNGAITGSGTIDVINGGSLTLGTVGAAAGADVGATLAAGVAVDLTDGSLVVGDDSHTGIAGPVTIGSQGTITVPDVVGQSGRPEAFVTDVTASSGVLDWYPQSGGANQSTANQLPITLDNVFTPNTTGADGQPQSGTSFDGLWLSPIAAAMDGSTLNLGLNVPGGLVTAPADTTLTGTSPPVATVVPPVAPVSSVATTAPAAVSGVAALDTTTDQSVAAMPVAYTGPVAGVQSEYVNVTSDNLNMAVSTPDWFLHSGSGNDALAVTSGTNVLDGGTGSNFLSGGTGADTFFVDDRGAGAAIWSTVSNFHAGDAATIWGVTPADFGLSWVNGQGASGYTGLTLHASPSGAPTASLTLAGFSSADLTNGKLSVSYGSSGGSDYMYVHGNG